ncbi:MAG: hypothetical protein JWO38_6270 [Gemmataceae bacterium]|nr:hypothetical protein [Gemmataceae bacterium]
MVTLYVGGHKVGTLADAEKLVPEFLARKQKVEVRDEAGNSIGMFTPTPPRDPDEPLIPWEPDVTREELERRKAEPGLTIDEVRKQLGWS